MSTSRDGRNNDAAKEVKFCDVGANLVSSSEVPDTVFDGFYFGSEKPYHPSDIEDVLRRARRVGVREILVTAGTAEEAKKAATRCRIWNEKSSSSDDGGGGGGGGSNNDDDEHLTPFPKMYSTVGVHPTRCDEFEKSERLSPPERYLEELKTVIRENADVVAAIGECGLDYDRLHFCEKETQKKYFQLQFELAKEFDLPLFLHSRNSREDFYEILKRNVHHLKRGAVVHSFTGSKEEFEELLALDDRIYIGVNGCSLKTEENVDVVKAIPLDRMLLETDAPWCNVKNTHFGNKYLLPPSSGKEEAKVGENTKNRIQALFGPPVKPKKWQKGAMIKDRCEPCQIASVCEIVAGCKDAAYERVAETCYQNSRNLFFPSSFR
jgi:TatD DNase family protein